MLTLTDWFCGAGGATQGAASVPGVEPVMAANHDALAIATHSTNFPDVEHHQGDIKDLDVATHPYSDVFWASPECTNWSVAKGKPQDYATDQMGLWGEQVPDEDVMRSRALMQDVIRYLRGMHVRHRPVKAGVVENVVDIRRWTLWRSWVQEIEVLGYRTKLIALNSMHAQSRLTPRAPQSRDRLYFAYWHESLGRDPDWDRWLRPIAHCPACREDVAAVQQWKRAGADMGRYRQQYVYVCPRVHPGTGAGVAVEPYFVPAAAAIDWGRPGERIGDRAKPLADKTLARIEAGIRRYARPISLEATGNTFERRPGVRTWPLDGALTTQTTSSTKAVAVPPLLVPVDGRDGKDAVPATSHLRTQTTRNETGLAVVPPMVMRNNTPRAGDGGYMSQPVDRALGALTTAGHQSVIVPPMLVPAGGTWNDDAQGLDQVMRTRTTRETEAVLVPPFIAELRGGGSVASPVSDALATVTASGNHHALVTMQRWAAVYGYDSGTVRGLAQPLPTQTTVEGDALLTGELDLPAVEDCLFRMLEPEEIHKGMAFTPDYVVLGTKRDRVRQLGNAVTPPVAEVLISALVECITGEDIAS